MLFAGFSLNDSNFWRIVDDVRQALARGHETHVKKKFGTAVSVPMSYRSLLLYYCSQLALTKSPFTDILWGEDLSILPMTNKEDTGLSSFDRASSARTFEIFLD